MLPGTEPAKQISVTAPPQQLAQASGSEFPVKGKAFGMPVIPEEPKTSSQSVTESPQGATALERSVEVLSVSGTPETHRLEPLIPWGAAISCADTERAVSSLLGLRCLERSSTHRGKHGSVRQWVDQAGHGYAVKIIGSVSSRHRRQEPMILNPGKGEVNAFQLNGHPNIVHTHAILLFDTKTRRFFAVNSADQIPVAKPGRYEVKAVVSEMVHGPDLYYAIYGDRNKRISSIPGFRVGGELALRIGRDIAGALAFMHDSGLVYRDLKIENIVIDQLTHKPVIVDFDTSKVLSEGETTRTFCGTLHYMPPEMIRKIRRTESGAHDHKVDAWALGALLLDLACGETPANLTYLGVYGDSKDKVETMERILWFAQLSDIEKKQYLNEHFSSDFAAHQPLLEIIVRLLENDPKKRMSVREALAELEKIGKVPALMPEGASAV